MTGYMAACSGIRGLRLLQEYEITGTVVVSPRTKLQVARVWCVMQLGSTVSTGDICLDRQHIVG